jgi:hypothetical protein
MLLGMTIMEGENNKNSTNSQGTSEEFYCTKCESKGVSTLLFFNVPAKKTDTWTRRKAQKHDYRCNACQREESRMFSTKKGRTEHKRRSESIQEYQTRRIDAFRRLWNDEKTLNDDGIPIIKLSNPERIMWTFIRNGIRSAGRGFTAEELTEVVREGLIEYNLTLEVMQYMEGAKKRGLSLMVREQLEPEVYRLYTQFKEDKQDARRRQFINTTRGEIDYANKLWDRKDPEQIEKIVTTPGHRDPEGNLMPRYHLLSESETFEKRRQKKERQMNQIQKVINREDEITQEHLKKEKKLSADQGSYTDSNEQTKG